MEASICCASGLQLSDTEVDGLKCEVNGSLVDGVYNPDQSVTCITPKDVLQASDVEESGIRKRILSKSGQVIYSSDADNTSTSQPPLAIKQSLIKSMSQKHGQLLPFVIISCSYLLFTITDGAVRMIVLLHAYQSGFSAMQVAIMFSFYELAGVVTNLLAGMLGARWGIKTTLLSGLCVQLIGIGMLFGWQDNWSQMTAIIYVTASQMMCGIAKDLTKLGGKTVTKLVTPEGKESKLFKLVSFITGFKNSLKGAGYFLGAVTVAVNYYMALGILMGLVLLAMPWAIIGLHNDLGRARKENVTFRELLNNSHNINVLSLSRVFLFGSRDLWFEVPLPFFLRDPASGIGWSRPLTGAFLAIFIIVYGQVQSWTPQLALQPLKQSPPDKYVATYWCATLAVPLAILSSLMLGTDIFQPSSNDAAAISSLTVLLYTFCILFAINSAIHSYLIVRYAEGNKVAMQVGVYYASNAVGRLVGTLASGALYTYVGSSPADGMGACLLVSIAFVIISTIVEVFLTEDKAGSSWMSPFTTCVSCTTQEAELVRKPTALKSQSFN